MKNDGDAAALGCVLLVLLVLVAGVVGLVTNYGGQQDITGTVETTYVKRKGEGDNFYVVVKDDAGVQHVLQNTDTIWWLKWNSADAHATLQQGRRVRVHVAGYRVYFLSWFPNVVRVEVLAEAPRPR